MLGNEKDYLATRVSYKLDLRGPEHQRRHRLLHLAGRGLSGCAGPRHPSMRHRARRRCVDPRPAAARLPVPGGVHHLSRRPLPRLRREGRRNRFLQRPRDRGAEAPGRSGRRRRHDLRGDQGRRRQQRRLRKGELHRAERERPGGGRSHGPGDGGDRSGHDLVRRKPRNRHGARRSCRDRRPHAGLPAGDREDAATALSAR